MEGTDYLTCLDHSVPLFDVHHSHAMLLRLFRTKRGFFGVRTQAIQEGDAVCGAPGCRGPRLVGGSYVHDFMNGEGSDRSDLVFEMVQPE